jgi:hypothetical protein
MSLERRIFEIVLLRKRYGKVEHGANIDWLLFKSFMLPLGWNREHTELLIIIPPGYPITPPDNFYVLNGLRLIVNGAGQVPSNYSENQTILGGSWAQFSYHAQIWSPAADSLEGDNLLTFILCVEQRFRELN